MHGDAARAGLARARGCLANNPGGGADPTARRRKGAILGSRPILISLVVLVAAAFVSIAFVLTRPKPFELGHRADPSPGPAHADPAGPRAEWFDCRRPGDSGTGADKRGRTLDQLDRSRRKARQERGDPQGRRRPGQAADTADCPWRGANRSLLGDRSRLRLSPGRRRIVRRHWLVGGDGVSAELDRRSRCEHHLQGNMVRGGFSRIPWPVRPLQ